MEMKRERLSFSSFEKIAIDNKYNKVIATPFDVPSANFFLNSMPLNAIKIASGDDIDNFLMFEEIMKKKNNIIFYMSFFIYRN